MKENIWHFIFCEDRHNPLDASEPFVYEMIRTNIPVLFVTSVYTFTILLNKFEKSQLITVWIHHQANTHDIDTFGRYHGETIGAELINAFPRLKFKYITRARNHPSKSDDKNRTEIISLENIFYEIKKTENIQMISDFFDIEEFKQIQEMAKKGDLKGQTTITVGGNFSGILNIGDKNDISNKVIIKNNDEYLVKELERLKVSQEDIKELINILKSDLPDYDNKKFGKATNNWIQKMLGKALEGTWQIGIETAGGILAQLLIGYFGM